MAEVVMRGIVGRATGLTRKRHVAFWVVVLRLTQMALHSVEGLPACIESSRNIITTK
jgi:hypothetical protein